MVINNFTLSVRTSDVTPSNKKNIIFAFIILITRLYRITHQRFRQSMLLLTMALLIPSCGGGSGDSEGKNDLGIDALNTGVFSDSPVGGLTYTINSISKITNANGEFKYKAGDAVTFSIGHVLIGEVVAQDMVTPLDLGYGIDTIELSNLLRLLQTLDEDGDSSNGISINKEALETASTIDLPSLSLSSEDYESDGDLLNFIFQVTGKDSLIDKHQAKQHFLDTLAILNDNGYKSRFDTDNDGVVDNLDHFPSDATETKDSDGNGIGDNSDNADDDFDGIANIVDNCPVDYNPEQKDIDNDKIGDTCDKYLPIASSDHPYGVVIAELRAGGIYYNESLVEKAVIISGPSSMAMDFPIFDYDGRGIGTLRDCGVDNIDCTPTRDCTASHIDCTATRDCRQTRDCSACILKNPFGGCIIRGNDPLCEADKVSKKLACETTKSAEKLVCEVDKSAWKIDCERIKSSNKAVCEADKALVKLDCERLKVIQMVAGEIWEAGIQEGRKQAKSGNPRNIPPYIRSVLEPYFDAALLDTVLWTTDRGNILSVAHHSSRTITLGDIIVFGTENEALYDVGVWAHELEHVKQYALLGIDHFAEYFADYWIDEEILIFDGVFRTTKNPGPREIQEYVSRLENKLEALAGVQSVYVCDKINQGGVNINNNVFNSEGAIIRQDRTICRPNYYD